MIPPRIRMAIEKGLRSGEGVAALARKYGVSQGSVSDIRKRLGIDTAAPNAHANRRRKLARLQTKVFAQRESRV